MWNLIILLIFLSAKKAETKIRSRPAAGLGDSIGEGVQSANAFIDKMNAEFDFAIPPIDLKERETVFLEDPLIDKNGDGAVRGKAFHRSA